MLETPSTFSGGTSGRPSLQTLGLITGYSAGQSTVDGWNYLFIFWFLLDSAAINGRLSRFELHRAYNRFSCMIGLGSATICHMAVELVRLSLSCPSSTSCAVANTRTTSKPTPP